MSSKLDHCREEGMWKDTATFLALHDVKIEVPAANVGNTFFQVIDKCTQNNHKKRCSMDQVGFLFCFVFHIGSLSAYTCKMVL